MTKLLNDMSVSEAASLALELIIYGQYQEDVVGKYEWREPYTGTFAEWVVERGSEVLPDSERSDFILEDEVWDNLTTWQWVKYEGGTGTRDGLTAERVAEYGGEGDGDQYWVVISITDGLTTRHFRKNGWYASYDGGYLDGDTSEVKAKEKTIVVFE
jgi:hypothetical protein